MAISSSSGSNGGRGGADERRAAGRRRVAALNAAAGRLAAAEAEVLGEQAGALLLASGFEGLCECVSAGLPAGDGQSMIDVQKYRRNFYTLKKAELFRVARVLAERNWFARRVTDLNCALFGSGFSLGKEADGWLRDGAGRMVFPVLRVHDDMLREWFTTSNVVALWRKNPPPGKLPYIAVPHGECVELRSAGGVRVLRLRFKAEPRLPQEALAPNGQRMFEALKTGKPIEIADGDEEWDFEVLTSGKSNDGLGLPSITAVMDDLDYIEAVKVGDWNGAWRRRITLLHAKKGYSITSGSNAGMVRTHAKASQLRAMGDFLKNLQGHANAATNFDQSFEHVVFPAEFFDDGIAGQAYARLIHWSGISGAVLLQSESRISGVSPYLMLLLRAEALEFRRRFGEFLDGILNSGSFLGGLNRAGVPRLVPQWGEQLLHTIDELQTKAEALNRGRASVRTIREAVSLDHEEECRRFREEHFDPDGVIPLFEQNQGLSQARNPEAYPGGADAPEAPDPPEPPGEPGRPSGNAV